jgi:hypothetical protein
MNLDSLIQPIDELNLYLVMTGQKSACDFQVVANDLLRYGLATHEYSNDLDGSGEYFLIKAGAIREMRDTITTRGLFLRDHDVVNLFRYEERGQQHFQLSQLHIFRIARQREVLDKLQMARSHQEYGLALDFPNDAVQSYLTLIDNEVRDGNYLITKMAQAVRMGIDIPLWLAYISFVPKYCDIVNGKISHSAENVGTKYMKFTRSHNPDLAQRVEAAMLNRRWPDRIVLLEDGTYNLRYDRISKP